MQKVQEKYLTTVSQLEVNDISKFLNQILEFVNILSLKNSLESILTESSLAQECQRLEKLISKFDSSSQVCLFIQFIRKSWFNKINLSANKEQVGLEKFLEMSADNPIIEILLIQCLSFSCLDSSFIQCSSNAAFLLNLCHFNFNDLNLRGLKLENVDLSGANFLRANLQKSRMNNVNISGADFTSANLRGISWSAIIDKGFNFLDWHTNSIVQLSVSSLSPVFASTCLDQIILWNSNAGSKLFQFNHSRKSYRCISISPICHMLAYGWNCFVMIFDLKTRKIVRSFKKHQHLVEQVAYSPSGTQLASASRDGVVKLWDLKSGAQFGSFEMHKSCVKSIIFSPDGLLLASASDGQTMKLWSLKRVKNITVFKGRFQSLNQIAISSDFSLLALGTSDKEIRIQNLKSGKLVRLLSEHTRQVTAVTFSHSSCVLASGSTDWSVVIWDILRGARITSIVGHAEVINVAFMGFGPKIFVTYSKGNLIKLWNLKQFCKKEKRPTCGHRGPITTLVFSIDGRFFASGSQDKTVKLWKADTGEEIREFLGHTSPIKALAFSPDAQTLASIKEDQIVRIWNINSNSQLHLLGHTDVVCSISFLRASLLATCSRDKTMRFWDVKTCQEIKQSMIQYQTGITAIDYSPISERLASGRLKIDELGSENGLIFLYDEVIANPGHSTSIQKICFSPNGQTLATCSSREAVVIWSAAQGTEILRLGSLFDQFQTLAFLYDGIHLATGSDAHYIKIWNVTNGYEQFMIRGHEKSISAMIFSPCQSLMVSGSEDKTINVWELSFKSDGIKQAKEALSCNYEIFARIKNKSVQVWNSNSAKLMFELDHDFPPFHIVFQPSSQLLNSYTLDSATLWDVKAMQPCTPSNEQILKQNWFNLKPILNLRQRFVYNRHSFIQQSFEHNARLRFKFDDNFMIKQNC